MYRNNPTKSHLFKLRFSLNLSFPSSQPSVYKQGYFSEMHWVQFRASNLINKNLLVIISTVVLLYPNRFNIDVNHKAFFLRKKSARYGRVFVEIKLVVNGTQCSNRERFFCAHPTLMV